MAYTDGTHRAFGASGELENKLTLVLSLGLKDRQWCAAESVSPITKDS